ncbi:hypothetical protein ACJJTC_018848 [Scirpophaga incertulas]
MKDVIDVMAMQNNRRERRLPDYRSAPGHSLATNFIFEMWLLGFNLDAPSPHRYLLHYLRSLQEWFPASQWRTAPIAQHPMLPVACLTLALHVLGVSVPLASTLDDDACLVLVYAREPEPI